MAQAEKDVETAIILMDAAVQIYRLMGFTKEAAWAEVINNKPEGTSAQLEGQMGLLFDTSWEKING